MKPFLLFFSLLISVPIFSQHYRTVLLDKEVYYDFMSYSLYPNNNPSRIINTDSFQVVGSDTIIYHQMNQEFEVDYLVDSIGDFLDCYYAVDTGFMGIQTILQDSGVDIFFNRLQDSIFIKTQADLNDTWIFYTDSNGDYFEAKVTNIAYENFLGISDTVKTIILQAKNNLGQNVLNPYNSLNIKISKNHGLIEGFNLFKFPYEAAFNINFPVAFTIKMVGFPYFNIGIKNLTAAEIFDFEVGDEFHRLTNYNDELPFGYELIKVNGKSFSQGNDTVFYDMHLSRFSFNGGFSSMPFDIHFMGDTTIFYDISENNPFNTKTLLLDTSNILWMQSKDGQEKTFRSSYFYTTNGCFPIPFPSPSGRIVYKKGFGHFFSDYSTLFGYTTTTIVYYKKNGVESGTPITFDYLLSSNEIESFDNKVKVFPNPTNNLLNFQFTEPIKNAEIRIYSSVGQLMLNQNVDDMNMKFDVSNWHKGIYFYVIAVEGEVVKQGQVLIQD